MGMRSSINSLRNFGDEHRGILRPFGEDSAVTHIYNWWKAETDYTPPGGCENLCHYFWVVVLFAPLLWIKQEKSRTAKAITIAAITLFALFEGFAIAVGGWWVPLFVISMPWAALCCVVGMAAWNEVDQDYRADSFWDFWTKTIKEDDVEGSVFIQALFWASLPIVFATYAACRLIGFIVHSRPAVWVSEHKRQLLWLGAGVIAVFVVYWLFFSGVSVHWRDILFGLGVALLGLLGLCLLIVLGAGLTGLKEKFEDRSRERRWRAIENGEALPQRSLLSRALRVPLDLVKLVFTFIVVVKRLLLCPYIDVPESQAKPEAA